MAWLERAVAAGFKDAAAMAIDYDVDALRDWDDFKKLVANMKGKQANMSK
jgi:hypothetical protein